MSILASHLRGIIVSNLREDMNPRVKHRMMELFNAIDQDLDEQGYSPEADTTSSTTDEALERFEAMLASFNLPDVEDTDTVLTPQPEIEPVIEDDNSSKFKGGSEDSEVS